MLKLRSSYHGRVLILGALIAAAFIANRKAALLFSYASIIGGSSLGAEETLLPSGSQSTKSFPMGYKSLRVTAEYSKLKLAAHPASVHGLAQDGARQAFGQPRSLRGPEVDESKTFLVPDSSILKI